MAKFAVEDGEEIVEQLAVTTTGQRRVEALGQLIVTDRRLVLSVSTADPRWGMSLGLLGSLITAAAGSKVTHEIRREAFASAEVIGKRTVRVASVGEGYARIWFDVDVQAPAQLAALLGEWAAAHG